MILYLCSRHRGGVNLSPRWSARATAVASTRHRDGVRFFRDTTGETHYKSYAEALDRWPKVICRQDDIEMLG